MSNLYPLVGSSHRHDYSKCSVCRKPFGGASDSAFCDAVCQTVARDRIERDFKVRVRRVQGERKSYHNIKGKRASKQERMK